MNKKNKTFFIQISLFLITLITTTLAGAEWQFNKYVFLGPHTLNMPEILNGLYFSLPFLGILTVHEFGHYLTARIHKVKVTLPFYIPLWFGFLGMPSIGTMGAFIRIKEFITSREKYFDIGIAGPLAGFVVALAVLFYGFTHLPPPEHIFEIHPEYKEYGMDYAQHVYEDKELSFAIGSNLLFDFFSNYVATQPERVPNAYEIIHYPWLFAGYLALFFTALNLMPIGQLDGGHILYGLLGTKWHGIISRTLFVIFVFYAGLGSISPYEPLNDLIINIPLYVGFLYIVFSRMFTTIATNFQIALSVFTLQLLIAWSQPGIMGYQGWLVYALLLGRFLGLDHPAALYDQPLDTKRKILGWITLLIFILCFTPKPFLV